MQRLRTVALVALALWPTFDGVMGFLAISRFSEPGTVAERFGYLSSATSLVLAISILILLRFASFGFSLAFLVPVFWVAYAWVASGDLMAPREIYMLVPSIAALIVAMFWLLQGQGVGRRGPGRDSA